MNGTGRDGSWIGTTPWGDGRRRREGLPLSGRADTLDTRSVVIGLALVLFWLGVARLPELVRLVSRPIPDPRTGARSG
jgi:hypothetical protein